MYKKNVLIVDDDSAFARKLAVALDGLFHTEVCNSEADFRQRFSLGMFDLIIMDMRLEKNREGLDLLKEVLSQDPTQATLIMTAYADIETYSDALESGALTYLDKDEFSPTLIARTVEAIVRQSDLRKQLLTMERRLEVADPSEIIGVSSEMRKVREVIQYALTKKHLPILITGEPGTGKKLAIRNILRFDGRHDECPFFHARCDSFSPGQLINSLFGTLQELDEGQRVENRGWIDDAKGGILLLEDIRLLDTNAQNRLTRLVEFGTFTRVGGVTDIEVDARIVIAVNTPSDNENLVFLRRLIVEQARGVEIHMPTLRARIEDLPLLAYYALQNLYRDGRTRARSLKGTALAILEYLPWPGNVRELKSAIEYAAIRADAAGESEIGPEHLPQSASEASLFPITAPGAMDYQLHLARAELTLVQIASDLFTTTKIKDLAEQLRYKNRFTFSRRIRKNLEAYPSLTLEFPKIAALFSTH